MKKKILFLILLLIPFLVSAEKCTIISGTGKNIGDEITCGKEHFYVIANDGENIKMLSKYNLYVGANYDKIKLDINETYVKEACTAPKSSVGLNCWYDTSKGSKAYFEGEEVTDYEEWNDRILEKYGFDEFVYTNELNWYETDDYYSGKKLALYTYEYGEPYTEDGQIFRNKTIKLYPYEYIRKTTEGYALQNELAKGVTGEKGKANYPIYATLILASGTDLNGDYHSGSLRILERYSTGYADFEFIKDNGILTYLNDYKKSLNDNGYEINNIDLISLKELNNLVKEVNEEELPLVEWYNDARNNEEYFEDGTDYKVLGDLKEYLPEKYSWLWNTTYWTKTLGINPDNDNTNGDGYYTFFISSAGEICYTRNDCYRGIPRAGIRPVVTIAAENVDYLIETKTDGNGEIKAEKIRANGGEVIKFTITPNEGYVLSEVKVTDADGNVVKITDNTFTMPDANVLIEAKFAPINPNTKAFVSYIIIVVGGIAGMSFYLLSQRKNI